MQKKRGKSVFESFQQKADFNAESSLKVRLTYWKFDCVLSVFRRCLKDMEKSIRTFGIHESTFSVWKDRLLINFYYSVRLRFISDEKSKKEDTLQVLACSWQNQTHCDSFLLIYYLYFSVIYVHYISFWLHSIPMMPFLSLFLSLYFWSYLEQHG